MNLRKLLRSSATQADLKHLRVLQKQKNISMTVHVEQLMS